MGNWAFLCESKRLTIVLSSFGAIQVKELRVSSPWVLAQGRFERHKYSFMSRLAGQIICFVGPTNVPAEATILCC